METTTTAGTLIEVLGFVSYDTKPTDEHSRLQLAYDYYNGALFSGELPQCLITLNRHKRARGYFWGSVFRARRGSAKTDEIAMNPEHFGRTDREILSTLAHEMCHLWQAHFGKDSRAGYHNKEWGAKMEAIGLMPSNTGQPGGKRTGQQMTHYIIDGGLFDLATAQLLADGFQLYWHTENKAAREGAAAALGTPSPSEKNKTKYTCAGCGQNAWAKPGANLMCGDCDEPMGAA
jgi:predicted SprT family Zn-dependent metalloprotease